MHLTRKGQSARWLSLTQRRGARHGASSMAARASSPPWRMGAAECMAARVPGPERRRAWSDAAKHAGSTGTTHGKHGHYSREAREERAAARAGLRLIRAILNVI